MTVEKGTEPKEVIQDLGWGRLVFGQTFDDPGELGTALRAEASGRRDIGMYLEAPHVFVALNPQDFFIDPSFTYRLNLTEPLAYLPPELPGVTVRPVQSIADCAAINEIYLQCRMVPADIDLMWHNSQSEQHMIYLVAVEDDTGAVVGTVTGIDHLQLFDDPENGSSLWCLAVSPTLCRPGAGGLLVHQMRRHVPGQRQRLVPRLRAVGPRGRRLAAQRSRGRRPAGLRRAARHPRHGRRDGGRPLPRRAGLGPERERRRGRGMENDAVGAGAGHGGRAALPARRRDFQAGRQYRSGKDLRRKGGEIGVLVAAG